MINKIHADCKDDIMDQVAPLKVISQYVSNLTNEAGDSEEKYLYVSFDQLFELDHAIHSCVRNIERVLATS